MNLHLTKESNILDNRINKIKTKVHETHNPEHLNELLQ